MLCRRRFSSHDGRGHPPRPGPGPYAGFHGFAAAGRKLKKGAWASREFEEKGTHLGTAGDSGREAELKNQLENQHGQGDAVVTSAQGPRRTGWTGGRIGFSWCRFPPTNR